MSQSSSSRQWVADSTRSILHDRRAAIHHPLDIRTTTYRREHSVNGAESDGHYRWRKGYKNLARPIYRTRRVRKS